MFKQNDNINILVIRFKRIGDAILSLPLCHSLKLTFPNSKVDFVLYEEASPLFEGHPYIDNVITITKKEQKNPLKYIKKVFNVTRKKYDIIIDIMSTPKSELFCMFSRKAPFRIGRYKKKRGFFYNYKMKEKESLNKVDKFLNQLLPPFEEAGFDVKKDYDFKFFAEEKEKEKYRQKMLEVGVDFSKPVIAFSIYSRVAHKIYPIDRMKEVVKNICIAYGADYEFEYTHEFSPTVNHKEQTEVAIKAAENALGKENVVVDCQPMMASEDFGYFLTKIPGCFVFLGGAKKDKELVALHNSMYNYNEDILLNGAEFFAEIIRIRLKK